MPFHTIAHIESVDAANAYNDLTPALADQTIRTQGDRSFLPVWSNLAAFAAGVGSGGNGVARNDGNVIPDAIPRVHDKRFAPIPLTVGEGLLATVHSDTTAAAIQWAVLFLSDGPIVEDTRPCYTMRGTTSVTLTVNGWTSAAVTFDENIPRGRYAIVGMRARSTNLVAARLFLPSQPNRPGVLGTGAQVNLDHPMFRYGGMGSLGEWEDTDSFNVEFLAGVADTNPVVHVDFVPVRVGP